MPLDPASSQLIIHPGTTQQFLERHSSSAVDAVRIALWRRPPEPWLFPFIFESALIPHPGSTDAFARGIAYQWENRVKHLSLTNLDETNDAGISAALQDHPSLESLTIRSQDMTDWSAEEIAKQVYLVRLRIFAHKRCPGLSDGALQHFSMLPHLRELEIHGTEWSISRCTPGLDKLKGFNSLEKLAGIKFLPEALKIVVKNSPGLESFSAPWEYDGGIISPITDWKNLTTLTLHTTRATNYEVALLGMHCKHLTELNLGVCRKLEEHGVYHVAKLTNLRRLEMRYYNRCLDIDFRPLAGLTKLEHLRIQKASVAPEAVVAIAGALRNLRHLHMHESRIDYIMKDGKIATRPEQVMESLGTMTKLESLSLNAYGRDVHPLQKLSRLQRLKIRNSSMTPKTLQSFSEKLTKLQELSLRCCYEAFPKREKTLDLPLFHRLTVLRIEESGLKGIEDRGLTSMPQLRGLSLMEMPVEDADIGAIVACCPELTGLNLHSCKKITDDALKSIADGLKSLTYLNVCYADVGDSGIQAILTALPSLRDLDMSYTKATDATIPHLNDKATKGLDSAYVYGSDISYRGKATISKRLSKSGDSGGERLRAPVWSN